MKQYGYFLLLLERNYENNNHAQLAQDEMWWLDRSMVPVL